MNTTTDTSPKPQTSNFGPIVNHYVPKAQIMQSIIEGAPAKSLCGLNDVIKARGGGRVYAKTNGVVVICPLCSDIYDGLKETKD